MFGNAVHACRQAGMGFVCLSFSIIHLHVSAVIPAALINLIDRSAIGRAPGETRLFEFRLVVRYEEASLAPVSARGNGVFHDTTNGPPGQRHGVANCRIALPAWLCVASRPRPRTGERMILERQNAT